MEDYVTYEQAVKFKELGFDGECNHWYHPLEEDRSRIFCADYYNHNKYNTAVSAPTLAQVAKWLRNKDINIEVYCFKLTLPLPPKLGWDFCIVDNEDKEIVEKDYTTNYDTYEEALSAGIDKALELLKEQ